ncbi:WD repeat-containing protein 73 isoform X1 [Procambarus clarkii]|uniref:WD repeat-containing protein 73 isoform X1 n=2 Tax=Procambarus clarkii TaxID=6728 RepID=UPI0037433033
MTEQPAGVHVFTMDGDNFWDTEESDEWFFDSIARYEDLLMYDVHGLVSCATFCNDSRLLLAVSRESRHEIWELGFPEKLITRKDAGLIKNRDFNLLAAGFTECLAKQMLYVPSSVIISGSSGVLLYSLPQSKSESDVMSLTKTLRSDVKDASLALSSASVYSGASLSSISRFDLNSCKISEMPKVQNNTANSSVWDSKDAISDMSYVNEKLFICLRDKGNVLLYEPRVGTVVQEIAGSKKSEERWTMDVSCEGDTVAVANSSGMLRVYDTRNYNEAVFMARVKVEENTMRCHEIRISPTSSLVSVCGYDKNVHVYNFKTPEVNNGIIFSHDGHRGHNVQNIVTHLWHPSQEKLLLSADNTGKLETWRFRQSQSQNTTA